MGHSPVSLDWPRRRLVPLIAALVCGAAPGAQSVLVVDAAGGPGFHYTKLRDAVDAAAEGDVLLFRAGQYSTPTFLQASGKSLVMQAEAGATVSFSSGFGVSDLAPGQFFALRGIDLESGIDVRDCAGPVWIEDARIDDAFLGVPVTATSASHVVLRRCVMTSHYGFIATGEEAGLEVHDSQVQAFQCTILGHDGAGGASGGSYPPPDDGAPGVLAGSGSIVWLYGCTVKGGDGGKWLNTPRPVQPAADGGPGVRALDGATVHVLDSDVQGGLGGESTFGAPPGMNGPPFELEPLATLVSRNETARFKDVPSPLREGESFTIDHQGLAGDSLWTLLSRRPSPALTGSQWAGPIVVGLPLLRSLPLGVTASGSSSLAVTAPSLPPGDQVLVLFDQPSMLQASPRRFVAGAPTMVVLLDAAF